MIDLDIEYLTVLVPLLYGVFSIVFPACYKTSTEGFEILDVGFFFFI